MDATMKLTEKELLLSESIFVVELLADKISELVLINDDMGPAELDAHTQAIQCMRVLLSCHREKYSKLTHLESSCAGAESLGYEIAELEEGQTKHSSDYSLQ